MDLVTLANQINEAGRAFCGEDCWAGIKVFMFLAATVLLLEIIIKALNRIK